MCFLLMRTSALVWVGKGRQQIHLLGVATFRSMQMQRAEYVL